MDENHQIGKSNSQVTTENKIWLPPSYANNKTTPPSAQNRRGVHWGFANRTVFDWVMLVSQVLGAVAIPFVVTILGLYLTQQVTQQQAQSNERQHQTDIQIASDQQQETALQTYLDRMSDLLLNQNLRSSKPEDEVRVVARARTLTVLSQLNAARKSTVFQFLYEAGLISGNKVVISLANANLEGATLEEYTLNNTDFSNANLENTNLQNTNIYNTNFTGVNLIGANLTYSTMQNVHLYSAQLNHANLTSATLFHSTVGNTNLDDANLTDYFSLDNQIDSSSLKRTKLINAKLVNTSMNSVDMSNADLSSSILSGSSLYDSTLKGTNLENTSLIANGVEIINDINGYIGGIIYPSGAHLIRFYAINNGFYDVSFISDPTYPSKNILVLPFSFAHPFFKVKFSQLYDPYQPIDADITNADLTDANLRGAKVTSQQLAQAKSLKGTTMPDGTIHP